MDQEVWEQTIDDRRSLYREDPTKLYSSRYFTKRWKMKEWEMKAGRLMSDLFNIKSAIDFGCGLGSYLEGMLEGKTEEVLGVDVCYDLLIKRVSQNMKPYIKKADVSRKLDFGKWDCVLAIGVIEHLLPEDEKMYFRNIINASSRLIIFLGSAELDIWHLNPQMKQHWIDNFMSAGCKRLIEKEELLVAELRKYTPKWVHREILVMEV